MSDFSFNNFRNELRGHREDYKKAQETKYNYQTSARLAAEIEEQEERAEFLMRNFADRCRAAAKEGNSELKIMNLVDGVDCGFAYEPNVATLCGAAELVVYGIREAGLEPEIRDWHDGLNARRSLYATW